MKNNLHIFLLLFVSFFIFAGCGYKPTATYAKNEINGKVYVSVNINIDNAKNSVLVKDAVNEMIVGQFNSKLTTNKSIANTIVNVSLSSVSFKTLQSDSSGFAKLYRTNVTIAFKYLNVKTNKTKSINVSGTQDYSVDTDSVITDAKKEESVKIAAQKALSDLFSNIALESISDEEKKTNLSKPKRLKDNYDENTGKSESYFFFK